MYVFIKRFKKMLMWRYFQARNSIRNQQQNCNHDQ